MKPSMKRNDILFSLIVILFFVPFFVSDELFSTYEQFNSEHGMIMSFIKFALLATLGETIGLRIKSGHYWTSGFGLVPRALVWGVLGLTIKLSFIIFTSGTIEFLAFMGMDHPAEIYQGGFTLQKLFIAFCISFAMNTIFGPFMMTMHKITDMHIQMTGGTIKGFFTPIDFAVILKNLNWDVQWNFVFKKTIPFFWYPAHTITFMLAAQYQVLFAAFLSIALGLILAIASLKSR